MEEDVVVYSCEEHIDMALDDFVNENENAPDMEVDESHKCCYCDKNSRYKITNIHNKI